MTNINLLPWRQKQREMQNRKRRFCYLALLLALIASASIADYFLIQANQQHLSQQVQPQPGNNKALQQQRQQFKAQLETITAKAGQESLDTLHVLGFLSDGTRKWALLGLADGLVIAVEEGDYLGKEHGRVEHIREDALEILKLKWGKQGVEKKRVVLRLRSVR